MEVMEAMAVMVAAMTIMDRRTQGILTIASRE